MDNIRNAYRQTKELYQANEGTITDVFNTIKKSYLLFLSNTGAVSILGCQFDVIQDIEETCRSSIGDSYIEGNEATQDHIANQPDTLRFTASIYELKYGKQDLTRLISKLIQTATIISDFVIDLGKAQQEGVGLNDFLSTSEYNELLFNVINNLLLLANEQAKARIFLKTLQKNRVSIDLSTPWGIFQGYYISDLKIRQSNTYDFSVYDVSLKKCNFVKIQEGTSTRQALSVSRNQGNAEGQGTNINTVVQNKR